MIERERHGDVLVLRLAHGKASALDLELLEAFTHAVREAEGSDARALVLTGTGRIFCAGVDLKRLVEGGRSYVERFLPALDEALLAPLHCPLPVVAAVNGHAIAGGAILAWTADWRLMADDGGRIGVPELQVGVPFPVVPLEIVRDAVPARHLRGLLLRGQLWPAAGALERGLVDELQPSEALLSVAISVAAELGALHGPAFSATKVARVGTLLRRIEELAGVQRHVAEVWSRPETLEAVRAYVARTLGS